MKTIELNDKQCQMLWAILNNAQAQGIYNVLNTLNKHNDLDKEIKESSSKIISDWVNQSIEEHHFINKLKSELE